MVCIDDKRIASSELSPESRKIAAQMLRSRVSEFAEIDWPKAVCADLRKFLLQILERHIEKKLVTAAMLEKISCLATGFMNCHPERSKDLLASECRS